MTDVFRAVPRLHHGAQGHRLHQFLFLLSLDVAEQLVQAAAHLRLGALGAQAVAEARNKAAQLFQLFGVGHVVNTVGQYLGLLALGHLAHALGHRAVGQQHEFLHQLVGVLGYLDVSGYGVSILVDFKTDFGAVKADGAV